MVLVCLIYSFTHVKSPQDQLCNIDLTLYVQSRCVQSLVLPRRLPLDSFEPSRFGTSCSVYLPSTSINFSPASVVLERDCRIIWNTPTYLFYFLYMYNFFRFWNTFFLFKEKIYNMLFLCVLIPIKNYLTIFPVTNI